MKKILIIDDIEANLKVLRLLLNRVDSYDIDSFTKPQEAVEQIKKQKYNYILTDYMMPYVTGEKIVEEVRNSTINKYTKIAIKSANAEDIVITSLILRYDNITVIPKPINKEMLNSFLKEES